MRSMRSRHISLVDIGVQMLLMLEAGVAWKLANLAEKFLQVCPLLLLLLPHPLHEGWTAVVHSVTVILFVFLK